MQEGDSTPPSEAARRGNDYRKKSDPATSSLQRILEAKIQQTGPLDFADFMASALYHPELGYYARAAAQVGRRGDFFTSVSVGPLFGNLLARRFLAEWHALGKPPRWRILECGAHDGKLAADVLQALAGLDAAAHASLEYAISEPLPRLRAIQNERLGGCRPTVVLVETLTALADDPLPGVIFGNEILDALPFHLVEWRAGKWASCHVACGTSREFYWQMQSEVSDPPLAEALSRLGGNFPEGYRTEVRTNFREFLEPLTRCISAGLLLWLDYGFARPEYYLPERHRGTLRTFSKHQAAENPLAQPGEMDITAHVDFTAVAEVATELGCQPQVFRNQGTWLTEIAREWLLTQEGRPNMELFRQFQTLTHPAQLGGSFHVLELGWRSPRGKPLPPRDSHQLALFPCSPAISQ